MWPWRSTPGRQIFSGAAAAPDRCRAIGRTMASPARTSSLCLARHRRTDPTRLVLVQLAIAFSAAAPAAAGDDATAVATVSVTSGPVTVALAGAGAGPAFTVTLGDVGTMTTAAPWVTLANATAARGGGGTARGAPSEILAAVATPPTLVACAAPSTLRCGQPAPAAPGADEFGAFTALAFSCDCAGVGVEYAVRAYQGTPPGTGGGAGGLPAGVGVVVWEVAIPSGAAVGAVALNANGMSPPQFAPFPAFNVGSGGDGSTSSSDSGPSNHGGSPAGATGVPSNATTTTTTTTTTTGDLLTSGAAMCHGSDKNHMFAFGPGGIKAASAPGSPCFGLAGGPVYLSWPSPSSPTGQAALVASAADNFHLNYNRVGAPGASGPTPNPPATIALNRKRGDMVFCASDLCRKTQKASGYTVFATEGMPPPAGAPYAETVPLFFSWSDANQDNWVTNSSSQPGPSYKNFGNPDGFLWRSAAPARLAAERFLSGDGRHHVLTASAKGKLWAAANGYKPLGVLGYLDPPPPPPPPSPPAPPVWSFGVSGEVASVPAAFRQRTALVYASGGINAAVDAFGATLRAGYNTTKNDAEDVFLQTMTMWTDNGAANLGAGWHTVSPATPPPTPAGSSGAYLNINWSMVDQSKLGEVATSVRATGVAPRGTQLDCWWYPVNPKNHPMWCGLDWKLPPEFYPEGTAGVRQIMGVPLMLYFPAVCLGESVWSGKNYTWTDTAGKGWLLPVAAESERFFGDLFDYGIALAAPANGSPMGADVWPGVWVPQAVQAGWEGTNVAAYETDFFWNMMADAPSMRTQYGAGERFLAGMDAAAASRNMTVQLCAGNPPELLKSLTLPTMTQARGSIDYAWDTDPPTMSSPHNWAAADTAWIFWATRMGLSKDNFWSTRGAFLNALGYGPDGHNGWDCELHAVVAVLTGVVGLGDWVNMTNATLVRRLARADGVLLKPDRPLGPLDRMFSLEAGAPDALACGGAEGARVYGTHATVAPEDAARAPELSRTPTRRLVSHAGTDAALRRTVSGAVASLPGSLLQWAVVGVDVNCSFGVTRGDLYPLPGDNVALLHRSYHGSSACVDGADAVASGCVSASPAVTTPLHGTAGGAASARGEVLFDATTQGTPNAASCGPAPNQCHHAVAVWHVWPAVASARVVPLGDLEAYTPLSGSRFRVRTPTAAGANVSLVAVGSPGERVAFTYLESSAAASSSSSSSAWRVRVVTVAVGGNGRAEFDI